MPLSKKLFTKGINSDLANEFLPEGQSRFLLNVRVMASEGSDLGVIESMNGNTLVSFTLPAGTNTCIGSKEDQLHKKSYHFIHNNSFNHLILEYDSVTNTIAKVFQDSINILGGQTNILNFQLENLITGINIIEIDPEKHLLYWTDNFISTADPNVYNEPRKINIEKGKYFMAGNFTLGYKTPFDPEILFRIKQPDDCGPEYSWYTGRGAHEIEVTSNITQDSTTDPALDPPPTGDVVVAFNVIASDQSNEFNPTATPPEYSWTVGETGSYSVSATVNIATNILGVGSGTLSIFVNGAAVQTVPTTPLLTPAFGGTNYTVTENTLALTAGDYVQIVVENLEFGTAAQIVLGIIFSGTRRRINYLFKQMPVFKTQFVYDDNDVSSWSAWSPYNFPAVIHNTGTGNDIVTQDNTIIVTVDTGISIVKRIRIAVKMLGKTLVGTVLQDNEFALAADLDKVDLQIADNSTYGFVFTNESNLVSLELAESVKLFDFVPLASQAQDIVYGNRLTDGLITEGQDPVSIDMIMNLSYRDVKSYPTWFTHLAVASFLKSGGVYKYGIVYYDHANRSGLTNIQREKSTILLPNGKYGTTLYVPFLTEPGYAAPHGSPNLDMQYAPQVNMEIYNRPPSWATHYQILRSKNESITKYFQFAAENVQYVDLTGTVVAPALATTVYVYINNILGRYLSENPSSQLVYDFTKGDRIRFIANNTGASGNSYLQITPFFQYDDTEISSYDPSNGIVSIVYTTDMPQNMSAGTLFEIYTPARSVINDNELMYEIGECYPLADDIHGNLIHTFSGTNQLIVASSSNVYTPPNLVAQVAAGHGLLLGDKVKIIGSTWSVYGEITVSNATNVTIDTTGQTLVGTHTITASTIYKAATGTLKSGDSFRVFQNMPWVVAGAPPVVYRLYMWVENMSMSNLWTSNAWDYARPNRIDEDYKRITRPSTVYWSEKFIPETFINGLSTVYDTSFQSYEQKYGGIYRLYAEDQRVILFQELKIGQVPVEQIIIQSAIGDPLIGQSENILSPSIIYYQGEIGIGKHPESFAVYNKAKYGIDVYRGVIWRLAQDGIIPISDMASMHNFTTDECKRILNNPTKVNIYGVFDVRFGEYIIAFDEFTFTPGFTLAFNERSNLFSTFYSYVPQMMCSNGIDIISFEAGALYTHNTNAIQANFYGLQYQPEIWSVINQEPSNVKILEAVSEETNSAWEVYEISTPNGQLSNLIVADFQEKENMQYAAVLRDANTPNVANPLFEGDVLRDTTFLMKLRYTLTTPVRIFAINVKYVLSYLSNK